MYGAHKPGQLQKRERRPTSRAYRKCSNPEDLATVTKALELPQKRRRDMHHRWPIPKPHNGVSSSHTFTHTHFLQPRDTITTLQVIVKTDSVEWRIERVVFTKEWVSQTEKEERNKKWFWHEGWSKRIGQPALIALLTTTWYSYPHKKKKK